MKDEMGVFSVVFPSCSLSFKLVLSISMIRLKPPLNQLKTTTERPKNLDTCPFQY